MNYAFNMGLSNHKKCNKKNLNFWIKTSSSHSKILVLHEASRECIWLRSIIHHIQNTCNLITATNIPTVIYEDNAACIAQVRGWYIKGDRTKHISPKLFDIHKL